MARHFLVAGDHWRRRLDRYTLLRGIDRTAQFHAALSELRPHGSGAAEYALYRAVDRLFDHQHRQYGFYLRFHLHLPGFLSSEQPDVQPLFFGERARTDRRSDDLSLAVAHVQARKDHPGLLWIFDPERPADLILRAAPTLDAYAVRAPELGGWEYCPASGFEPDARSAEIRYRLGLFADELRRPVDEQPGDDPDHAALGKHGADPGSHGADHRDDRFRRLAIRFSICLTGIHRSRSG